ncbi:L-threonylcarbamoyladenylate synthase [Algibacter sp. R77976]|uniref:L-threonylcarbamoyladenylate synthase n=1 Tax=Algibacter sp. R77976 TaxID=3093873 RepID=UPI0037C527A9
MNEEINRALQTLKAGGLILYPTDTNWSVGCDASNPEAIDKIYALKQSKYYNDIVCLISDDRMLKKYIKQIPSAAINIIEIADNPTTIIYDDAQNLAKNIIRKDGCIAIRIPDDDFCYWLTRKLNGAIVSIPATVSKAPTPKSFKEIAPEVLKGVDYVVNLHHEKIFSKPSSIIKLSNNGIVKIIRE